MLIGAAANESGANVAKRVGLMGFKAGSGESVISGGTVAPEGNVTAPVGSAYLHDGGLLWRKATGTGNTGWVAQVDTTMVEYAPHVQPPAEWWTTPDTVSNTSLVIMSSGMSGIASFMPFEVGPNTWTISQMGATVTTAGAGLTDSAHFLYFGVYSCNADGSLPNTASGPLATGTVAGTAMNSTGAKTVNLAGTLNLPLGRYFMAVMYRQTTAPTTYPTFNCINTSLLMPVNAIPTSGNAQFRAYQITGQTTLTTVASPTFTPSSAGNIPVPWLLRSA